MKMKDENRKAYFVTLDKEKTEYVKIALKKSGMSLSGFVDAAIAEFYDNLIKMNEFYQKSPSEMTVPEFLNALSVFMGRMMEGSEEKEKELEKTLKD